MEQQINVLIVEDTPEQSDLLTKVLVDNQYHVVGVANSHQKALEMFLANKVDILVIDIFLNGNPDGILFAETINALPGASRPFVFLTSSTDRSIFERAKLTRPFSFLLKPFNTLEVLYALEMAIEKFYGQEEVFDSEEEDTVIGTEYFFIKKKDVLKKVAVSDIVHVEVEERYCSIYSVDDRFVVQISMNKMLELLDATIFFRTHRNFIVNVNSIEEIQTSDNLLQMSNGKLIPIGEKYRDVLKQFRFIR
jgi:DNA-binding LytR/AlgR family response regulator